MNIAKLTDKGMVRVLSAAPGMTFVVDRFSEGSRGQVAHVRDYRYPRPDIKRDHQIWSLSPDEYELVGG
jgi:hypothetical protein